MGSSKGMNGLSTNLNSVTEQKNIILSIIVPVYNRQEGVLSLLDSLKVNSCQRLKEIEVIIVDDGSIENIVIPEHAFSISVHRMEINSGAPKAREYGFQRSIGKFVHFHDSDDSFGKDWLCELFKVFECSPELDILLTARYDVTKVSAKYRYQKFFHHHVNHIEKIRKRLVYRNCLGPLGGVIFSRRVVKLISFKSLSSCQDWQMYLEAMKYAKHLKSSPHLIYNFNIAGSDRISHDPRKKLLGHLQLSRLTAKHSLFNSKIRYFYLLTCRKHIISNKGSMMVYYKVHRIEMWFYFLLISVYWRLS